MKNVSKKSKESGLKFNIGISVVNGQRDRKYWEPETAGNGVAAVLSDSSKGCYYVAEKEGKLLGSLLTTFEWSDWRNGTVLWIQSVYVIPEYRRKGVYSSLYSHVRQMVLNDNGLKGIRLYAEKSNLAAHKAYKKLGMNADHYITFEWLK